MGVIRKRKFVASLSYDEYDEATETGTIDSYYAGKDNWRMAPPGKYPIPWPYSTSRGSDEAQRIVGTCENELQAIIDKWNIEKHTMRVQALSRNDSNEYHQTLVVNTKGDAFVDWAHAIIPLQSVLNEAIKKQHPQDRELKIRVEIRNSDKMFEGSYSAILRDSSIHLSLLRIERDIETIVEQNCVGLTSISYHMAAQRDYLIQEERIPTVLVGIMPQTRASWGDIERTISKSIEFQMSAKSLDIQLDIELVPGQPVLLNPRLLSSQGILQDLRCPEGPRNGSSICTRGNSNAGSIGVFVHFKPHGSKDIVPCFLTCYHVIAPGCATGDSDLDENGYALDDRAEQITLRIDYPASMDVARTEKIYNSHIENQNDPTGLRANVLKTMEEIKRAGGVGMVLRASGYNFRNDKNRRMDWALIQVTNLNYFKKNRPPIYPFSALELLNELTYDAQPDELITKVGEISDDQWVAKVGRTSGVTAGQINAMESKIYWENSTTKEILADTVKGGARDFALPGDSGGMVFNNRKEWVGMVIGKDSHSGIITSAREIMEDIEKRAGGTIVLPQS